MELLLSNMRGAGADTLDTYRRKTETQASFTTPAKTRKHFPETWLWTNLIIG